MISEINIASGIEIRLSPVNDIEAAAFCKVLNSIERGRTDVQIVPGVGPNSLKICQGPNQTGGTEQIGLAGRLQTESGSTAKDTGTQAIPARDRVSILDAVNNAITQLEGHGYERGDAVIDDLRLVSRKLGGARIGAQLL